MPTRTSLARALGQPVRQGRAVGLMGGSFNPAHAGHLAVTREALKRLDLDQVWWLVAPRNPLKAPDGIAPLASRLAGARAVTGRDRRIRVMAPEALTATRFTIDTVVALQAAFPRHRFVWLLGSDNFQQLPRWHRWRALMRCIPIAVMTRPSYDLKAMTGLPARIFQSSRLPYGQGRALAWHAPPAWTFLAFRHRFESSTALRAAQVRTQP